MARFVSRYSNYRLKLKSGTKEIREGLVFRKKPQVAEFENGIFDTKSLKAKNLSLTETDIIKTMRRSRGYGKDFWEMDKEPVTLEVLLNTSIAGLPEKLEEVHQAQLLHDAIEKDDRKSAVDLFRKRLQEL